jgi:parallel beta-helix repeat protein
MDFDAGRIADMNSTNKARKRIQTLGVMILLLVSLAIASPVSATSGTLMITSDTKLTENHSGSIIIGADDVTLDCDGRTVTGSGSGTGILLDGRTGVTVKKCHVTGFTTGFSLEASTDNTFEGNTAKGNTFDGFATDSKSASNTFTENKAHGNGGFGFVDDSAPANTYNNNKCAGNTSGGSSPSGLCQPQP